MRKAPVCIPVRRAAAQVALATLLAVTAGAAPGTLDPTFGTGGKVTTAFGTTSADAYALVFQPDGKMVVAGAASDGSTSTFALARYHPTGSLDATFGGGGRVTTPVGIDSYGASAIVLQPDGKLVAAGNAWKDTVDADFALVRYNANGSLDATFGTGGTVTTTIGTDEDDASALVLQPDGKLVAAGLAATGGVYGFALVRYTANGSLDPTFGTGGKVTTSIGSDSPGATALVLQPDGKLVAAGTTSTDAVSYDVTLVRYTANGGLDATFGTGGKVTTPVGNGANAVSSLVLQPDGKLVAAGYAFSGSTADFVLLRYNANGSLDASFGTGGKVTTPVGSDGDYANALVLQPDGKLLAAGYVAVTDRDFAVVRYHANGSLDASFGTGGKVTTPVGSGWDVAFALALQPDGKLVAAGYAANGSRDDVALVRYQGQVCGDGLVDTPEPCDAGAANGTPGSCCTGSCQFVPSGTTCTGGLCDGTGHCLPPPTTTTTTTSTTTSTTTTSSTTTASPTTTGSTTTTSATTTSTSVTTTAAPTSTTRTTTTTTTTGPPSTTTSTSGSTTTTQPTTTTATGTTTTSTVTTQSPTTSTTATSTTTSSTTTASPTTTGSTSTSATTTSTSVTTTAAPTSTIATTTTGQPTTTTATTTTTTELPTTTRSTDSTTSTSATTSTTGSTSSSTTAAPTTTTGSTSTTTLPCPNSGLAAVTCVLRAVAAAPECAAEGMPAAVQRRVDQATTLIEDGAAARSATRARKFARKAAIRLRKAARLGGGASAGGRLSAPCARALTALLLDAAGRAARFAATPG